MTGASNQQWLIAETSGIRNLVRQCRFGRFNGPSSGANSLVELAKPTPFSTFHTDLGHLTLLVAGGLFLSTPRVFLKYLQNGLS